MKKYYKKQKLIAFNRFYVLKECRFDDYIAKKINDIFEYNKILL